jgi:hypothetical protein
MAIVRTVTGQRVVVNLVEQIVLELDEEEAGYLLDLLLAHVAGPLVTNPHQPLWRVHTAMREARAKRIRARNGTPGFMAVLRKDQ